MNACLGVGGVGEELGRFGRGEQRIEVVYNHVCCFRGKRDRFLGGSERMVVFNEEMMEYFPSPQTS
jgi:hypothetical protein